MFRTACGSSKFLWTREQTYGCQRERMRESANEGVWHQRVHGAILEMDSQQGPTL